MISPQYSLRILIGVRMGLDSTDSRERYKALHVDDHLDFL
jgi:hypothetical protein